MSFLKAIKEWWTGNNFYKGNISSHILDEEWKEGWQQLLSEASTNSIDNITLSDIRSVSRFLFLVNPHYKGLIKTYIKYIAGKKFYITSDDERANEIWLDVAKKNSWNNKFKEIVRRFFRDGEVFFHLGGWYFIEPDNICSDKPGVEYGILKEGKEIVGYYVQVAPGQYEFFEASEILHIKDTDENQMRGIPDLLPIMVKAKQLDKWLDDRILLNRIRSSIALLRKHKASPTQVKTFADSQATSGESPKVTSYGASLRKKIPEPGTVLDTTNIEYEFLKPDIQAKDVAEDGRNIGLCFSALTGLPEFITRGDASNGNYASTMISEGPAEKEMEYWQDFFESYIAVIWKKALSNNGYSEIIMPEPMFSFPPIISRNAKEETERNQILHEHGVISTKEWRRREQVDNDQMDEEINVSVYSNE